MAFEYQESDIIFCEHNQQKSYADGRRLKSRNKNKFQSSPPICVPELGHFQGRNEWPEVWEGGGGEVVPPHLMAARRVAGKMEFSVCSGKGRTLKGRDLKEVRNEILRMTGFLEA